jgi:hypothetical protein
MRSGDDNSLVGGVFAFLWEKTKDFPFSLVEDQPKSDANVEARKARLRGLIVSVYSMGKWEFKQMPDAFRVVHGVEDGGQQALLILVEETKKCAPKAGYTYDVYMRYIVRCRLKNMKRNYLRKNPPVGPDLSKLIASVR